MPELHFHPQVPDGEDDDYDSMRQPHTSFAPQPPEVLNVTITPEPGRILDGHLEYRDQVKIRVVVDHVGSSFRELALGDLPSMQHLDYLPDPPQLFLSGIASCASCMMPQAADIGQRCNPPTFSLTPSEAGAFLSFDDYNTQYSRVATFKIPFRYRNPSPGQWSRCGAESLIISFELKDSFGGVATFQLQTPLRIRKHEKSRSQQAPVQLHYTPAQPNLSALSQASSGIGIDTTVPPPSPPPSPHVVDIIPQDGPHSTSQRVWVQVQNLPRGNGEQYTIEFSQVGMVATSFRSEEGDRVQILECTTPIFPTPTLPTTILPTPFISCLSLRHTNDPQTPIGSSQAIYSFY